MSIRASLIERKILGSRADIVKYQLITYCFVNKIIISEGDIACIVHLACKGKQSLNEYCQEYYQELNYQGAQQLRNCIHRIAKAEQKMILKEGKSNIQIYLNPSLNIITSGPIYLNYKLLSNDSKES